MNPSVKTLFDAVAGEYDRQRRSLIPCFDEFYGMALSLVESSVTAPRILDLGAGTGLLTGFILQKFPDARLTLIDISDSMLEGARKRFADRSDVRYIAADYVRYTFAEDEPYDAVVSSLSIHHLPHDDKRQLFRTVFGILKPGGVFVNADQVQARTPAGDAFNRKRWLTSIRASGLSTEAIEASIERRKVDINATQTDQLQWMDEAGFTDAECVYKNLDFAVFAGTKPQRPE